MPQKKAAAKTAYFSLLGNLVLALVKGIAGVLGNSNALIADAVESATDVFSSILVILGLKYASRPADENHPYGHGKIEPIITFLIAAFLVVSATIIGYESVKNILSPQVMPSYWTLFVLLPIILWKEVSYRIVIKKSRETNSSSLKADAWHHRSDAITSVMSFLGISVALLLGKGYEVADDWAALLAAFVILYNAYLILRPALGEIMDEHFYDELLLEIKEKSVEVKGVLDTEKCFIRKAGMEYYVDLHAIVDAEISVREGHDISHRLKDYLLAEIPNLSQVLIHIEPYDLNSMVLRSKEVKI